MLVDLANERTYLAWMRTGLSTSALGLALIKFVGSQFLLAGLGLAVVGISYIVYATIRYVCYETACTLL